MPNALVALVDNITVYISYRNSFVFLYLVTTTLKIISFGFHD